jgi:ribonuclease VapC
VSDGPFVFDASAIIAFLVGEPFTRFDPKHVNGATVSTVNLSEVLTRLPELGVPRSEAVAAVRQLNLRLANFDEVQASMTAELRPLTRHMGLSLGDRACLALGKNLGLPTVTADRAWANLDVGVEVVLIR